MNSGVGGSRRTTVVLTRAVGDVGEGARGAFEGCSRGGILCGNHSGTGLMYAVATTHCVAVVAVHAAALQSPTESKYTSYHPQVINKNRSRTWGAPLVYGVVLLVSACKVAVPNVEGSGGLNRSGSVPVVEMLSTTPTEKMGSGFFGFY